MSSTKCTTTKRSKPTAKNAERERSRVRSLRNAFQSLQSCLPSVPPDTKLSKLDILILATNYIAQLTASLESDASPEPIAFTIPQLQQKPLRYLKFYHPIKKWPMRSRLYSLMSEKMDETNSSSSINNNNNFFSEHDWNNNNELTNTTMMFDGNVISLMGE